MLFARAEHSLPRTRSDSPGQIYKRPRTLGWHIYSGGADLRLVCIFVLSIYIVRRIRGSPVAYIRLARPVSKVPGVELASCAAPGTNDARAWQEPNSRTENCTCVQKSRECARARVTCSRAYLAGPGEFIYRDRRGIMPPRLALLQCIYPRWNEEFGAASGIMAMNEQL